MIAICPKCKGKNPRCWVCRGKGKVEVKDSQNYTGQ